MPQIIYYENMTDEYGNVLNTTPAATYATTDLSAILDNIASGEIPTGTGKPLPVNWENKDNPPWAPDGPTPQYESWKNY